MSALFSSLERARGFFLSPSPLAKRDGNIKTEKRVQAAGRQNLKGNKVTKRVNTPSPSAKSKKVSKKNWHPSNLLESSEQPQTRGNRESLEGETLVGVDPPIKPEMDFMDEATIVVEERVLESTNSETDDVIPFEDRAFHPDDERIKDWSDDEVWIFNKLVMRGQEPLLPYKLASEFPSWPDVLFSRDQHKVFITNISRSTTNLASAFNRFLYEGVSARCRLQGTTHAEPSIERALKGFHRFIVQDGRLRLKKNPPLICTTAAAANEDVAHVVERCIQKMYKAGRKWRRWLQTEDGNSHVLEGKRFATRLPTIYGFVIKHSVLALMTWDSSLSDDEAVAKPVRTIGTYDWKIVGQDVWHALAVGIVECKARNYLMELDREGLLGKDRIESDPDL